MDETEAWEDRLNRQIAAYHDAALLHAAVRLGLPARLASQAQTVEQLAEDLGLSAPHLHRFLRGLVTLGLCQERPNRTFALTEAGQSLASEPSRLAEKVQIVVGQYWRPWAELASSLQTGEPSFAQVFGLDVRDWRRVNAAQGALYESYLAKETLAQAGPILEALDLSGANTVAEIGGHGALIATVLRAHPHLTGILFDRLHIVEGARPFLQSLGVAERMQRVGGDVLAGVPVKADLYLLNGLLRQWDDAKTLAILANCREAMPETAKLVIIERLMPENAADDASAIMLDLHMMAITGGRVRSLAEIESLLARARLARSNMVQTSSGLTVLTSVRT